MDSGPVPCHPPWQPPDDFRTRTSLWASDNTRVAKSIAFPVQRETVRMRFRCCDRGRHAEDFPSRIVAVNASVSGERSGRSGDRMGRSRGRGAVLASIERTRWRLSSSVVMWGRHVDPACATIPGPSSNPIACRRRSRMRDRAAQSRCIAAGRFFFLKRMASSLHVTFTESRMSVPQWVDSAGIDRCYVPTDYDISVPWRVGDI